MSQNKEIQLDEESKYDLELSVPSEIYKKEYKMIYIPSQSKILIENLDKKIKNNFIDLNSIEKVRFELIWFSNTLITYWFSLNHYLYFKTVVIKVIKKKYEF